tara:strand:+ start:104 stop:688 length:585 start_codon:yes stop_codon:yes gene_type:complete
MSENNTTQTEANQVNKPSTEASQNNVSDAIPKSRFDEVNTQKNDYKSQVTDLQSELDKFRADQESARQKQLEKNGEYKTLLEEANAKLEKSSVVVKEYEEYKSNKRNSLMETLTEDTDKSIAEGLSLDKLELYVNKVTKVSSLPTNTSRASNQQPVGEMGGYSSYAEWADKDPKGYEENNNSIKGSGIKIGYGD